MSISKNQLKLVWVAKTRLRINETDFRSALVQIAGVTSTKDLDQDGFRALVGFFEYCGFEPFSKRGEDYGVRPGMASFAQIELIRTLWHEYTRGAGDEDMLNRWLDHYWKISSLRFLKKATAPRIITALKAMKSRAA